MIPITAATVGTVLATFLTDAESAPMVPPLSPEDRSSPSAGHGTPLLRNVGIYAG
jgi:hypothetical protein